MANEFKIKKGLIVTGASGGTVVDIQGSQGQLFSVTDDLSGSIFAVSDISGVPILDVNSTGLVTVDGPITQTGGGATILSGTLDVDGEVIIGSGEYLSWGTSGATAIEGSTVSDKMRFYTDSTLALTLDASQNATFAGDITVSGGDITVSNAITGISGGSFRVKNNGGTTIATFADDLSATFAAQAFSTATSSGDASSTLTTKGYVDGLITGATIYRGAWDPSGGGYGSPDLSGVTQTSGYYYICSAAGTAEPNGTGTEPDTWETGDWVIYNDVSGTGQWQKIDNSSVLSGVGTGQTVALWEGAGSVTDSETLGNAPITVSGNDATFAGNITLTKAIGDSVLTIEADTDNDNENDNPRIELKQDGGAVYSYYGINGDLNNTFTGALVNHTYLRASTGLQLVTNGSSTALTLDTSQNATFAGDVSLGLNYAVSFNNSNDKIGSFTNGDVSMAARNNIGIYADSDGGGDGVIDFHTGDAINAGSPKMTILNNGNVGIGTTSPGARLQVGPGTTNQQSQVASIGTSVDGLTSALSLVNQGGNNSDGNGVSLDFHNAANWSATGRISVIQPTAATGVSTNSSMQFSTYGTVGSTTTFEPRMTIDYRGNVGIGTTSPQNLLHLGDNANSKAGTIRIDSFVANQFWKIEPGTNTLNIKDYDGTSLVSFDGASNYALFNGGNVGIGTTSPASKLDVQGGMSQFSTTLTNNEDWENSPISINERGQVGSAQSADKYAPNLNFHWGGRVSKSLWMDYDGVLNYGEYSSTGIPSSNATISTGTFLGDLNGTINTATTGVTQTAGNNSTLIATTAYADAAAAAVPIGNYLPLSAGTSFPLTGGLSFSITTDTVFQGASIKYNSNNYVYFTGGTAGALFGNSNQSVRLQANATSLQMLTGSSSRMFIDSSGNVGIGTTSPATELQIGDYTDATETITIATSSNGAGRINFYDQNDTEGGSIRVVGQNLGSKMYFSNRWNTDNDRVVFDLTTGNVGIGTTSPSNPLTVSKDAGGHAIAYFNSLNTDGYGVIIRTSDTGNDKYILRLDSNSGNTPVMYATNAGNVGIGTTSPLGKLQVNKYTVASQGNQGDHGELSVFANSGDDSLFLGIKDAAYPNRGWSFNPVTNGVNSNLQFKEHGATSVRMTIESGGNVGIGTTNPDSLLEIEFAENTGTTKQMLHLDYNPVDNYGSTLFKISSGSNSAAVTQIEQVTSGGNGSFGTYQDTNIINRGVSSISAGNINFITGSNTSTSSIVMTIGGGSQKGNVGIGETSPTSKIHVIGQDATFYSNTGSQSMQVGRNANERLELYVNDQMAKITAIQDSDNNGTHDFILNRIFAGTGANNFRIQKDGSTQLIVDTTGNVGIGTTSPTAKLHIHTNDSTTNDLVNSLTITNRSTGTTTTGFGGEIRFQAERNNGVNQNTGRIASVAEVNSGTNISSGLSFWTSAVGVMDEKVRISYDGKVGIGTTTPNAKLDVQGTQGQLFSVTDDLSGDIFSVADISGVPIMNVNSDGTSYFDGNVGIGTTSPYSQLQVGNPETNSQTMLTIASMYTATAPALNFRTGHPNNSEVWNMAQIRGDDDGSYSGRLEFLTRPASAAGSGNVPITRMVIDDSGNVGIGTTNPTYKLDLAGNMNISGSGGYLRWNSGDIAIKNEGSYKIGFQTYNATSAALSTKMVLDTNGNVGIGTTSPGYRLEVDGGIGDGVKIKAGNAASKDSLLVSTNNDVSKFLVQGDGKVIINSGTGISGRTENFQVFGKQIITNTGTDGPVLYLGYNSSGSNTIQLGRGRTADGLSYMDFNGEVMSAGLFGFRIIRYSGQNASTELKQVGTGAFKVTCSDSANILLNPNSGSVGISQTNPSYKLDVTGDGRFTSTVTAANFILSSDKRLKENVEKVCDNKVEADWKTFELKTEKGQKRYGVIAQELEKTNPEFVREDSQGFKSVAYIDLLIAKIAELEARLEKLEK
jgi:hypothetical protein